MMGMTWTRLSVSAFVVAVLCIAWLALRGALLGKEPVSLGVQVAAVALMIWARVTFGLRSFHASADPTGGGLIKTGPYRYLRHPIYAAVLYFIWAGLAVHLSVPNVVAAIVMTAAFGVRMYAEEHLIVSKYPEYAEYASRTRRVVPFVF